MYVTLVKANYIMILLALGSMFIHFIQTIASSLQCILLDRNVELQICKLDFVLQRFII